MCQIDYGKMCIETDCQTKSAFIIIYYSLQSFAWTRQTTMYNQFDSCIVTC